MTIIRLLALSGVLVAHSVLAAPLYKVVGPDGKVSFTDQMPTSGAAEAVKAPVNQSLVADTDRDPLAASLAVYAKQMVVESSGRFCVAFAPTTSHEVVVARDAWRSKNFALNEKKTKVMASQMSVEMRNRLADKTERENEAILDKIRNAPMVDKVKWCRNLPASFTSMELDPSRNPMLVRTIMSFKVPD
jgi:hypothetical protein